MEILRHQDTTSTQVRTCGPLGVHLEMLRKYLAPQGYTWVLDEMKDHFAQAPDFEFHIIRDIDA
eukprot:11556943-Alexandrium_andersonii.AAC.1